GERARRRISRPQCPDPHAHQQGDPPDDQLEPEGKWQRRHRAVRPVERHPRRGAVLARRADRGARSAQALGELLLPREETVQVTPLVEQVGLLHAIGIGDRHGVHARRHRDHGPYGWQHRLHTQKPRAGDRRAQTEHHGQQEASRRAVQHGHVAGDRIGSGEV
ncbi:MAG: hypothetical protein ACK55I_38055, partial [bacterium]